MGCVVRYNYGNNLTHTVWWYARYIMGGEKYVGMETSSRNGGCV